MVELCEVNQGKTRNVFSYGRTLKTHDFTNLKTVEKICLARNCPTSDFFTLLSKKEKRLESFPGVVKPQESSSKVQVV